MYVDSVVNMVLKDSRAVREVFCCTMQTKVILKAQRQESHQMQQETIPLIIFIDIYGINHLRTDDQERVQLHYLC